MNQGSYYAYNYYLQKGYSPQAAAGIAGNLHAESNFNPGATGDNGTAYGAAQWRGSRLDGLKNYASSNNLDYRNLDTQLGYVDHEMRTGSDAGAARAYQQLQNAQTPGQAAQAFMQHYERPNADPAINHIGTRQSVANSLYGSNPNAATSYQVPTDTTGIASLGPQAATALPTVQDAATNMGTQAATQAANQAAVTPAAEDPMGGIFGLLMQAKMGGDQPTVQQDMTVPKPKMIDNRSPDQQMAAVSQTPDVYQERMRRSRSYG